MTTIVKTTSKGQITIPIAWREKFNTDRFIVNMKDSSLEIKPLDLSKVDGNEYTVFDAIRDNKGRGIKAKDLSNIIKETL